ncbi:COX15/CtaA family protein [Teredinibacter sp. KSP-S5-2]|uniref:COX15/CtaA family protein n=1 Tax=Teredinibacter sp. KSP-S5-2 TaxID=3034506 RepID=UPI0029351329|nr:COX15/CtaA family protein [Teredinibacter sp. KSP-S5-2]WNO09194.1 COX15/CtaA family protein [Teredinibacter sp. KSP-S5-2]
MNNNSTLIKLSILAVFVASVVVVLGAFTRLAHAGLGCPDWPTCYGHLWVPNEAHEIEQANLRFEETPVETDKTWPEQIHRIFASSLGLIVFALFFVALRKQSQDRPVSIAVFLAVIIAGTIARAFVGHSLDVIMLVVIGFYFANIVRCALVNGRSEVPIKLAGFLAGLVVLQGLFGMWTVTLKLWPQVVTAHLLGGFATLSLLWLMLNRSIGWHWQLDAGSVVDLLNIKRLALIAMVVVVVQIALGGWTSSNYAALACPDLPLCQNQIIPDSDFKQGFNFLQSVGPNYLGGLLDNDARTAIHFSHRLGALLVTFFVGLLAFKLLSNSAGIVKKWGIILACALIIQIALGLSNILFSLPLSVAVLHNAGGALLLIILVTVNHRIHSVKTT